MNQLIKRLMVQLDGGVDWCIENRKKLALFGVPGSAVFVLFLYLCTGSEFLLFALGFVLAIVETGAAVGLGLLYFRYDQERKDLRLEVADALEAFMTGTDAMGEWDTFLAEAVRDRELERVRQRCIDLPKDYPPQVPGEFCSVEGMEALLEIVETLRAGIASKFYAEAKIWLTQGRRRYRQWKTERDERTALRMAARAEQFLGYDEDEDDEDTIEAAAALPAAAQPQARSAAPRPATAPAASAEGMAPLQNATWRPEPADAPAVRPINVGVSIDPPVLEQMREARSRSKKKTAARRKEAARDAAKEAKATEAAQAAEAARAAKAAKAVRKAAPAAAPPPMPMQQAAPMSMPMQHAAPMSMPIQQAAPASAQTTIQAAIGRRNEQVNFTAQAKAQKGMTEAAVIERLMKEGMTANDFDRMHQELSVRGKTVSPAEVYRALTSRRARKDRRETVKVSPKTAARTKAARRAEYLPAVLRSGVPEMPQMRRRVRLDVRRLHAAIFIAVLVALPFAAFRIPEGAPVYITGEIREFSFDSTSDLPVMLRSQFEAMFGNRGLSFVDGPRIYVSDEDYDRCWADAPVDAGRGYLISVQAEARPLLIGGYEVAEIRKVERIDVDNPTQEAAAPSIVQPTTWHDPIRKQLPRKQYNHMH